MIPLHVPPITLSETMTFPSEDYVSKLKNLFRATFNKENVVFTTDGRNAIYLALKLMGLRREDEVLIPAYACDAVHVAVEPICKPVYVDIDRRTFNIDPQKIEAHISPNTRAIIVIHLYGNPCPMEEIIEIAKDNNLLIIENVAQALGGRYHDKMLGSFGDFTVLSFRFSKDITSFRGGALLTNEKLDPYLRHIPLFQVFPQLFVTLLALKQIRLAPALIYSPLRSNMLSPLFSRNASKFNADNKTLSNYQCYLLYHQFTKVSYIIEKRRQNAAYYSGKLKDVVTIPVETNEGEHTFYRYTIQTDRRDRLYDYLLAHGIEADKMYDYSLALASICPNSKMASKSVVNIPVNHKLLQKDIEKIAGVIHEFSRME